jgi:hypothetical protein
LRGTIGVSSIAASVMVLAPALEVHAQMPNVTAPTAIEQALIENSCAEVLPSGALDSESFRGCLKSRLLSLRADFGFDLDRVTRSERRQLDAKCSGVLSAGREAYLDCLDAELSALLKKRKPAANVASERAESLIESPAPKIGEAIVPGSIPEPQSSMASGLWMGTAAGLVIIGAAVGLRFARRRRAAPSHACRQCGAAMPSAGELCAACRHEAAEERRRINRRDGQIGEERQEGQKAQDRQDGPQGQREGEKTEGLEAEDWRERQAALERLERESDERRQREQEAEARLLKARREEEAHTLSGASETFDPYQVLGVTSDATPDEIQSAYELAKSKYDATSVADLGYEVRKHYKAKSKALDRAYQTLVPSAMPR